MTDPTPDLAFTLAQALLDHMMTRLYDTSGEAPQRSFVADGGTVPEYDCCEGVAWVRVALIQPTDADDNPYSEMRNLPAGPAGHSITLEAGIVRCTPVPDEQGNSPDPDDYTAAAKQAASDRQQLRLAILCDFPADVVAANADGLIPSAWTPMDEGGCGGGYMTVRIGTSIVL